MASGISIHGRRGRSSRLSRSRPRKPPLRGRSPKGRSPGGRSPRGRSPRGRSPPKRSRSRPRKSRRSPPPPSRRSPPRPRRSPPSRRSPRCGRSSLPPSSCLGRAARLLLKFATQAGISLRSDRSSPLEAAGFSGEVSGSVMGGKGSMAQTSGGAKQRIQRGHKVSHSQRKGKNEICKSESGGRMQDAA